MAQEALELEVIGCEACGVLNERASTLLAEAQQTIAELERDLRGKRATITRLERTKAERLKDDKRAGEAMEVLKHWQKVCMPSAREIDSEDRLANVLARLKGGFTVEELKECADGYAKRPYVTTKGRAASGKPTEWHADAELIYRTPKNVQQGLALAKLNASTEPDVTEWEKIDWRKVRRANHRVILRALDKLFGKALRDEVLRANYSDCPRCGGTIAIYDPEDCGNTILRCVNCGLDETLFFRALRDEPETQRAVDQLTGRAT